jgi:hypothetical protein
MCGQRVHLIQHQWMSSFFVTLNRSAGRRAHADVVVRTNHRGHLTQLEQNRAVFSISQKSAGVISKA